MNDTGIASASGSRADDGNEADVDADLCGLCLERVDSMDNQVLPPSSYRLLPSGKRFMTRMNKTQKRILEIEFEKESNWSNEKI